MSAAEKLRNHAGPDDCVYFAEVREVLARLDAAETVCELAGAVIWACESPRAEIADLAGHLAEHGCGECEACRIFDALSLWEKLAEPKPEHAVHRYAAGRRGTLVTCFCGWEMDSPSPLIAVDAFAKHCVEATK